MEVVISFGNLLRLTQDNSANQKLKQELNCLKHQLEEVLQVSKNKADIVLEDCKQALEKSKMKIMEDEIEIKELPKKIPINALVHP